MKEILKRISDFCKILFGYGIMIVLFGGGLTFFGYLAAIIIGGNTAENICEFIYNGFMPIIIRISTILILFGLFSMYLVGETAFTPDKKKSQSEGER